LENIPRHEEDFNDKTRLSAIGDNINHFWFFLIPIQKSGQIICDWITGHAAAINVFVVECYVFPVQIKIQFD
jgi:hypothetical protein